MLTLVWVLASNHCALENVTGLGFLSCVSREGSADDQDNSCDGDGDGCATVENQIYKAEDVQVAADGPLLLLASFLSPLWTGLAATEVAGQVLPEAAPPELPRIWQFSQRAALSPRAPSIAS